MVFAAPQTTSQWEVQAQFHDYMSAVNPVMPEIAIEAFLPELYAAGDSRVIPLDMSAGLKTNYPCTTPNLLASFIRVNAGDVLPIVTEATSHMFYVIYGKGETRSEFGTVPWQTGDLLTSPNAKELRHYADEETVLYWVCDAPLLQYLGVVPSQARFEPVLYRGERLNEELREAREANPGANRSGILLSTPNFAQTMTLTHTLWSLYNALPAHVVQKPHRHNSVAIDYCVAAGPDTYTLIGKEIDADGNIIDPVKAAWIPGAVFITPPGYWHSHHNESDEDAIVLPIQDAGLLTNMQVLDFQYVK